MPWTSLLVADVIGPLRGRAIIGVVAFLGIVLWFIWQWRKWRKADRSYSLDIDVLREKTRHGHDDRDDTGTCPATDETDAGSTNGDM